MLTQNRSCCLFAVRELISAQTLYVDGSRNFARFAAARQAARVDIHL
jgi:hypothetical protein